MTKRNVNHTGSEAQINSEVVVLENGVELNVRRISPIIYADMVKKYKKPQPPIVFVESKGRKEENPSDPTYIEALNEWEAMISTTMIDSSIVAGTSVKHVPDGILKHDSEDTIDMLNVMGVDTSSKNTVYLHWVKYIAAVGDDDISNILSAVARKSGVAEDDVQTASTMFRDKEGRK